VPKHHYLGDFYAKGSVCIHGAVFLSALAVFPVWGNNTATLRLSATVPETVAISVESTEYASSIDFSDNPEDVLLGIVQERSNSSNGYQVYVTSENASANGGAQGMFVSETGEASSVIPYWITYDGQEVTYENGTAKVTDTSDRATGSGNTREVRLQRLGYEHMPEPGSYGDTLTFTIASN